MKIAVAVLFGGKTVEHEISVISAVQAMGYLNTEKYDIVPVYITKAGKMYTGEKLLQIENFKDTKALLASCRQVVMTNLDGRCVLLPYPMKFGYKKHIKTIDVAMPIVHGTNVEDGALQGFLKTLDVPFTGCDVLASAVGMDKHVMKLVFESAGIPVLPCKCFLKSDYYNDEAALISTVEESFAYPVIVKPVNLGSSVGISKAKNREELVEALDLAFRFAPKVLVERAITSLREINCSVLGDIYEAEASECEEPLNATDILSYEDKYMSGGKGSKGSGMASLARKIPADLTPEQREEIRAMAVRGFQALGGNGVSRIDFMIDTAENKVYLNEINTIPGSLSFYLWKPVGVEYPQLLDKMIALALKRQREEGEITYSFDTSVLEGCSFGGSKGAKGSKM